MDTEGANFPPKLNVNAYTIKEVNDLFLWIRKELRGMVLRELLIKFSKQWNF